MKELGIQPNYTYRMVFGCSEETGMTDLPLSASREGANLCLYTGRKLPGLHR